MVSPLVQILSVFFMAGFKFMVAVFMVLGYNISLWVSVPTCTLGGVFGVALYIFFGELIVNLVKKFRFRKDDRQFHVNKTTRLLVKLKRNHGLLGIAVLTPVFLTVPIGTLAAIAIGYKWQKVLIYMFSAFLFWSSLIFGIYEITGINVHDWIMSII